MRLWRFVAPLVLLSLAGSARAQDLPVDLDAINKTLDQVVVLAAKRPQPLREAPASTSIITAADLEAYGWRDFTEAVASLAGFYTTQPGDNTYFGVRGLSQHGDSNGRILILVDGHAQQEQWSHSAYPEGIGLDATMIDHIEVLRGPASALYGSLGFLAIINIVTRRGNAHEWARATYEMEDANGFRGVVNVGHRFANQLEFGISANAWYNRGRSYKYPDLADNPTCIPDLQRTCTHGVSDRATDEATGVSLFAHLDYKGLAIKASYQWYDKHIPFAPYRSLFNDPVNHYLLTRGYVDVSYTAGTPDRLQAFARAYFDSAGYTDDLALSDDMTAAGRYVFHDEANPWWAGAELKLLLERAWADRVNFALTGGGEFTYLRGNTDSGPAGAAAADRVILEKDLLFGAGYLQAEVSYARKIFLTLGGRLDAASFFKEGVEVSPRVGLVLLPYRSGTFKLLYGHGFIHPSWYYTFFDDNSSIAANHALSPERADNYELVFQQELAESTVLTASTFYIHGDDLIAQGQLCVPATVLAPATPDCPEGMSARAQRQNLKSFQSVGAELGVTGKLRGGVRLYANYSYAHATLGDGTRPENSPEHMAKVGVSVPLWRDHLVLGVESNLISQRRLSESSPDETDVTVRLNAHLTWKGLPRGLAATLKVYNLTGQTWYEPSQAEDSFPILRIPHDGPTVVFRLSYAF